MSQSSESINLSKSLTYVLPPAPYTHSSTDMCPERPGRPLDQSLPEVLLLLAGTISHPSRDLLELSRAFSRDFSRDSYRTLHTYFLFKPLAAPWVQPATGELEVGPRCG